MTIHSFVSLIARHDCARDIGFYESYRILYVEPYPDFLNIYIVTLDADEGSAYIRLHASTLICVNHATPDDPTSGTMEIHNGTNKYRVGYPHHQLLRLGVPGNVARLR